MRTQVRQLFRWAIASAMGIALALAPAVLSTAKKIDVAPPPPVPPEAKAKPSETFTYDHQVKKVTRDRKPVVALLRPGDVVELAEWLPFGRGVGITDTNPDGTKSQTVIKTGREDARVFMPAQARQFLTRELLDTGEFVVIERERILEIARELALSKTQAVDPMAAPRPGRLIGVHYILEGSFYPVGGLPADDPALEAIKREAAKHNRKIDPTQACVMYITVIKVETGEIKAVACGADFQPAMAVKRAVEDLVDQLGAITEPIKVAKVNATTGLALLDIGDQEGVKPGDVFALGPAGATGPAATPAATPAPGTDTGLRAVVVQVAPLLSVVKVRGDPAAAKEGQVASRVTGDKVAAADPPKDEKPTPVATPKDEKPTPVATPKDEKPALPPPEKKPVESQYPPADK